MSFTLKMLAAGFMIGGLVGYGNLGTFQGVCLGSGVAMIITLFISLAYLAIKEMQ